ncbi:ROK family protein [Robertmurraya sp. P23]|uniref:ROK family protein n=1 Tax=Robertmurraya sp. P23 TaxID=3436931 RepID=UPI003D9598FC
MKKYIAFDVGGTKVKHGIVLEDGTIVTKGSYSTTCDDLEVFLVDMVKTIMEYKETYEVEGVAISLPGFINPSTGFAERAGAITALDQKNLKELLEARVPLRVEIENDGNCSALAERWSGNAVGCNDFICYTIGTGIGGGIMVNGKIVHGHTFRGGEFGFMLTKADEKGKEMLHTNSSTASLIKRYREYKGLEADVKVEGESIFSEAAENKEVDQLIHDWLEHISYGLFNLAVTLNPQKILIGGGVSAREGLIEQIQEKLEELEWWKFLKVEIAPCKHRNDAGMIGAVYHFMNK